jgi:hypothetical protein
MLCGGDVIPQALDGLKHLILLSYQSLFGQIFHSYAAFEFAAHLSEIRTC